jgi:hypothetical protein
MALSPALRTYNKRVLWLSLLYGIFLCGAIYAFNHHLVGGPAGYAVAILPALPIVGVFITIGRYLVEEQDEYLRMLMVRQTLWASGFALSLATMWGFLESFRLAGHIEAFYIAVIWFFGLGVGACINKLTIQRGGEI